MYAAAASGCWNARVALTLVLGPWLLAFPVGVLCCLAGCFAGQWKWRNGPANTFHIPGFVVWYTALLGTAVMACTVRAALQVWFRDLQSTASKQITIGITHQCDLWSNPTRAQVLDVGTLFDTLGDTRLYAGRPVSSAFRTLVTVDLEMMHPPTRNVRSADEVMHPSLFVGPWHFRCGRRGRAILRIGRAQDMEPSQSGSHEARSICLPAASSCTCRRI